MFHVAYAINEPYIDYCLVSMVSLLENNKGASIWFHILTDTISEGGKEKIIGFLKSRNAQVSFHEVPDSKVSNLALNGWGKYAWYRLFLPELVESDIDRILYLDTDTIVCGSLSDLFAMDLSGVSLAGCMDIMGFYDGIFKRLGYPKKFGYICSGVLLMNLDYFRRHSLSRKIIEYSLQHPEKIDFPDQDSINCVCHPTMKLLPLKYDMLAPFFTNAGFIKSHEEEVKDMLHDPRIIHYAGCNPWIKRKDKHYYHDEFRKYADMVGGVTEKYGNPWHIRIRIWVKGILGRAGVSCFKDYIPKKPSDFSCLNKLY